MKIKLLANENIPALSYKILKDKGWDIIHIGEDNMGITDEEVMEIAIDQNRIIITFDSDYGELIYRVGYQPPGVIYLRLRNFSPDDPANILEELLNDETMEFYSLFTVVDDNQIRQRKI